VHRIAKLIGKRFHYAWFVVGVVFLVMLASSGLRAAYGVLIVPLEQAFGWTRAEISAPLSVGLLLFGLMGPFAAALMQRFGVRCTLITASVFLTLGCGASLGMTQTWHLLLTWGVTVGAATGSVAVVLGAVIANRWFVKHRGLVLGILTASIATGQLIFLPLLAAIAEQGGWQPVVLVATITAAAVIPLVYFFVPEHPRDIGLAPLGGREEVARPDRGNPLATAFSALGRGVRSRTFWLLSASFFVCGVSTNGLVGTHLIPMCFDVGVAQTAAAGLLALMGVFNVIGAAASGWLSDRWDSRWLLFWYYSLRGVSLLFLPYSDFSAFQLSLFAAFYGLDWIATGPPTMKLISDAFGAAQAPIIFGWVFAVHQMGAAFAAWGAGVMRTVLLGYTEAFVIAGIACFAAAALSLAVNRSGGITGRLAPLTP
jgi:predicted MFS family arabinose efflux permease